MTQEITTTRAPNGAMTTTTPGAPANQYGDLFAALIRQRQAQQAAAAQQVQTRLPIAYAPPAAPRYAAPIEPEYRPQMGTAASASAGRPKEISRWVPDPFANPYAQMATGLPPGARKERLLGDRWEFEDLRPHGASGGIQGGGAMTSLRSPFGGPADPRAAQVTGRPSTDFEDNGDSRRLSPIAPRIPTVVPNIAQARH